MRNLYYEVWADAIFKLQSIPANRGMWKFYSILFMSMTMALNLWLLDFILMLHFKIIIPFFPFDVRFTQIKSVDAFLSFFLSYLLPFFLLNYFAIFRCQTYKKLLLIYKPRNGKYFFYYFVGTISSIILYFTISFILINL